MKQERLDATIAALKTQHGEEEAAEAIAELEELMTPADRKQLSKLKATRAKYVLCDGYVVCFQ